VFLKPVEQSLHLYTFVWNPPMASHCPEHETQATKQDCSCALYLSPQLFISTFHHPSSLGSSRTTPASLCFCHGAFALAVPLAGPYLPLGLSSNDSPFKKLSRACLQQPLPLIPLSLYTSDHRSRTQVQEFCLVDIIPIVFLKLP
jgi:hypothetical protein